MIIVANNMNGLSQKHLISAKDLSHEDIALIFVTAKKFKESSPEQSLKGHNILSLFFEDSTRTRISFEIATNNLGANFVRWDVKSSSTNKGETLQDTILTLNAMKPDAIIVRHSEYNAPHFVSTIVDCPVINAGDSWNQHPTQALLDAFTIQEHFDKINGLTIAICGDIAHSRVAQSNMILLHKLGANIRIIAPPYLLPEKFPIPDVAIFNNMEEGLQDCDAIMMLRNQKERMEAGLIKSDEEFFQNFGLTKQRLALAKPNAVVLHPGPMNRNVEIADDVADDQKQSLILQQVQNGVYIRMAILELLIKGK